jgi:putative redox protein
MGEVNLRWLESHLMVGTDSNGHSIVIGRDPQDEARWLGMKPSDLLLLAAASCATYDVAGILVKQREPLQDLRVRCTGEQAPETPHAFTRIHLHYTVVGDIRPERVERAIRLAEEKYCTVLCSLRPGAEITSDYEIRKGG